MRNAFRAEWARLMRRGMFLGGGVLVALAALALAAAARCGPVELHLDSRHSLFRRARLQRGADLGERMHRAICRALRKHERVILVGSDAPALEPRELRRAERLLRAGYDAVLAPAEDGGYALIGVRRTSAALFRGIPWGGAAVFRDTVRRLEGLGWRWRALRTVWDLDRPEDLERFRARRFSSASRRAARR